MPTLYYPGSNSCAIMHSCYDRVASGDCATATSNCFQWADHATTPYCSGFVRYECRISSLARSCPTTVRRLEEEAHLANWSGKASRTTLGFVRIPKTGSTTVMKFLDSWSQHTSIAAPGSNNNKWGQGVLGCMYGFASTRQHLPNRSSVGFWNRCPYIPFGKMVALEILLRRKRSSKRGSWRQNKNLDDIDAAPTEFDSVDETSAGLEGFTIVRDPFDRLVVSLQIYTRSDHC